MQQTLFIGNSNENPSTCHPHGTLPTPVQQMPKKVSFQKRLKKSYELTSWQWELNELSKFALNNMDTKTVLTDI